MYLGVHKGASYESVPTIEENCTELEHVVNLPSPMTGSLHHVRLLIVCSKVRHTPDV